MVQEVNVYHISKASFYYKLTRSKSCMLSRVKRMMVQNVRIAEGMQVWLLFTVAAAVGFAGQVRQAGREARHVGSVRCVGSRHSGPGTGS